MHRYKHVNVWQLLMFALLIFVFGASLVCEGFITTAPAAVSSLRNSSKSVSGASSGVLCARDNSSGKLAVEDRASSSANGKGPTCTCRNCKGQFRRDSNTDDTCSYHPGLFSGRLNRINDVDTSGLEYFWSCCGEYEQKDPGCIRGRHVSYDDPPDGGEGGWRSPLTGTLRSD